MARCKSVLEIGPLAEAFGPSSRLYQHLQNVRFAATAKPAPQAASSATLPGKPTAPSATLPCKPKAKTAPKAAKAKAYTKGKAQNSATARASPKSKASPKPRDCISTRRASGETSHDYRVKNFIFDGDPDFDRLKYGNAGRVEARQKHWKNYILKKPAAVKRPASRAPRSSGRRTRSKPSSAAM